MKSLKYDTIIKEVEQAISKNQQFSILNKLEFPYDIKNKGEFVNFVLIILVMMEKSIYENAYNLLIRKVIVKQSEFAKFKENDDFKEELFEIISENAVYPFVNISTTIRRFISGSIYNKTEEQDFLLNLPSKEKLIELNLSLLQKYASQNNIQINILLALLYNCVEDIDLEKDNKIKLNPKALILFRVTIVSNKKLFSDYLEAFLRPKYQSASKEFPGSDIYVPEPFFDKIFDSPQNFIDTINKTFDKDLPRIGKDILNFMKLYLKEENRMVKAGDLDLDFAIHKNLQRQI
jgi:hypothetical protein